MAQFDVYANQNAATCQAIPYLLDVQADLLDCLGTRVVVPLVMAAYFGKPATHLNPTCIVDNQPVVMSTAELAGVSVRLLGRPICSLKDQRDEIVSALDFLITGF